MKKKLIFVIKKVVKLLLFFLSRNEVFREYHHFPFDHNKPLPPEAAATMASCCEALDKLRIIYRLTDGTILGLYRQGGFIPHDNDIDIDVLDCDRVDQVHAVMNANAMKLGRKVVFKNRVHQLVYYNNGQIIFDMIFWYSEGDKIYNYSERGYERIQEKRFFENLSTFEYKNRKYPMPSDIEEWLEKRFGNDWRIPKTYKDDWKKECGDIKFMGNR
jgi:phosphorylcholine metabolism protein LicD